MTREEKIFRISGQDRPVEQIAAVTKGVLEGAGVEIPEDMEDWFETELAIYAQMCRDNWVGMYDPMSDEDIDWLYSVMTDERFTQVQTIALVGVERNLNLLQTFLAQAEARMEVRDECKALP